MSKASPLISAGIGGVFILVLTGSLAGAASSPQVPSFSRTYSLLQKLSKDTSREDWLQVVHSFLAINETVKDRRIARRSLFLAGKVSLDLYRQSGKVEDLDEAIRHLSHFCSLNRRGPYVSVGLRELKEAHSLKRKTLESLNRNNNDFAGVKPVRTRPKGSWPASRLPTIGKTQPAANSDHLTKAPIRSESLSTGASHQLMGNPFYDPQAPDTKYFKGESKSGPASAGATSEPGMNPGVSSCALLNPLEWPVTNSLFGPLARAIGRKLASSIKTASLPPSTVNDGVAANSNVNPSAREFVVAIDPGHGGKDPGAVSRDGRLKEKDLTLRIAKRLETILQSKYPALKVVLTRSDDRYLSLEERTAVANSANADVFISIHCNSAADSSSTGIETYYLSKASSRGAMRVAARENAIPLSKMNDVEATLLDLMVTSKKSESAQLAISVQGSLSQNNNPGGPGERDRGVRQAPFYVPLGAKMPAILVECAFISNEQESRKLTHSAYLSSIAERIADGTVNYLKGLEKAG